MPKKPITKRRICEHCYKRRTCRFVRRRGWKRGSWLCDSAEGD